MLSQEGEQSISEIFNKILFIPYVIIIYFCLFINFSGKTKRNIKSKKYFLVFIFIRKKKELIIQKCSIHNNLILIKML